MGSLFLKQSSGGNDLLSQRADDVLGINDAGFLILLQVSRVQVTALSAKMREVDLADGVVDCIGKQKLLSGHTIDGRAATCPAEKQRQRTAISEGPDYTAAQVVHRSVAAIGR